MTIAEKLTTIAENQQRVYDAGKQAEYDRFWDIYQQNGNRTNYSTAFAGHGWTVENFKPKYNIIVSDSYMIFRYNRMNVDLTALLQDLGIELRFTGGLQQYTYQGSEFTRVPGITTSNQYSNSAFNGCQNLVTIDKITCTAESGMDSIFTNCKELQNVTFDGVIGKKISVSDCPKLTHASLMSVINALENKTSGTFSVTLGSTNLAKLTDAEKAIATQKGWTLA